MFSVHLCFDGNQSCKITCGIFHLWHNVGAENILDFGAFQILDDLSVLLKDFADWRQEQILVKLPMEAPCSHPQDTGCELLHTGKPGPGVFCFVCFIVFFFSFDPWWTWIKARTFQTHFHSWVRTHIFFTVCYCLPFRVKCQSHKCVWNL